MAGNRIVEAVGELLAVLQELKIGYYAGSSVASSVRGIPRFTQDIDIIADLKPDNVEQLSARLSASFYADTGQMREALRFGRSFKVIHFATGFKIDIFPLPKDEFRAGELIRAQERAWEASPDETVKLRIAGAEDTVLEKLIWYWRGGEVADRQWSDVLGVAATSQLDWDYMRRWSPALDISDLTEQLAREAGQIQE